MATIKFVTNLHPFQNGREWQFHPNFFEGKDVKGDDVCDKNGKKISFPVPNEAGVYIVGVKIPVSDPKQFDENGKPIDKAVEKFCPLYVGIQKKIKNKIKGHRDPRNRSTSNGELNSYKELFDLSTVAMTASAGSLTRLRIMEMSCGAKLHRISSSRLILPKLSRLE